MVELAICLPMILILMAGMANLGSILWQIQQFSDAARHGARFAAATSNNGVCDQGTLEGVAQTSSNTYVTTANSDPWNWWTDAQADAAAGTTMDWPADFSNPTGFSRRVIKVRFTTGGVNQKNNCMICFSHILRKINVTVEAVFALEQC
jgi:Flp pilus assembly protein TadG